MRITLLFFCLVSSLLAAASIRPDQLRTEYRANPQGIDVVEPRLSWILTARNPETRGLRQTAYRITVSSSAAGALRGAADLWDTGKVVSAQSIQVTYGGKPLTSGANAFWRVKIWDNKGEASDWSTPAHWSMGLLRPEDWSGKWIGKDESGLYKDPNSPYLALSQAHWIAGSGPAPTTGKTDLFFRGAVDVPSGRRLEHAYVVAGGDAEADVFVNGTMVTSRSPAIIPMIVSVAYLLHEGPNVIGIHLTHTGTESTAECIGAVRLEFATGEPIIFATGKSWLVSASAPDGWENPAFAASSWNAATELDAYGAGPWGEVGFKEARPLPARMIRKEFGVTKGGAKKVTRATVYYSGLGLSELYLNGARVGDSVLSPGLTDYDKRVFYITEDVTGRVTPGQNAMGLILGNGRYFAPRLQIPIGMRTFGYPKAIVQLEIEYQDGTRDRIVSDGSWKLSTNGPIRANNEYDGEDYDARKEIKGWDRAGFDDSAWETAQVVAAPAGQLTAQMAEPIRVNETLQPKSVKEVRPGVYRFDMGQNMVGWMRLHVSGEQGTEVTLRHAETLDSHGDFYVANLRSARATDVYTLKGGGVEVWEPRFTYHGFRYVEMSGFPGTPTLATLEARVVHDSMEPAAGFESSSSMLNAIHHNIYWGVRSNYRSIPTDCPQRDERQGWLGDRSQVSRSESYLFNVAAFYAKWETDLVDAQRDTGSVPDVVPTYWTFYNDNLTWPSTFVFVPGMLYDQYGDKRVLAQNYPAMRKWIEYIGKYEKDGLMPKDTYGDWCVPPESPELIHSEDPTRITDKTLIGTAYYYQLFEVMARYARILDKPTDEAEYKKHAAMVAGAFQQRFFKPQPGDYDNGTQTSSILPLQFGMVPEDNRPTVLQALQNNIETVSHGHVGTGLVGAQWLMRTLTDNGLGDTAYEIATQKTYPGLGYMVEQGATTVWELWNGNTADPAMNSANHVMQIGDMGVWMYEYLAGIRADPEKPGFQHVLIHPYTTGDLTFVKGSHPSMYGVIKTAWTRNNGKFTLTVTVPPNATASVWIPTKDAAQVTESGHPAGAADGVKFVRMEAGSAIYDTGSGTYRFEAGQ